MDSLTEFPFTSCEICQGTLTPCIPHDCPISGNCVFQTRGLGRYRDFSDLDPVVHAADTQRLPRGALCFLTFEQRVNGATQDDLVTIGLHLDSVGVQLSTPLKRGFDRCFYFDLADSWLYVH